MSNREWVQSQCRVENPGIWKEEDEYMSEESKEELTVLRVGTEKGGSSKGKSCQEFYIWRVKVVSTLDGPIWSKCSIALTCPARSHFQQTPSREIWGQGLNERYCSSKEEE